MAGQSIRKSEEIAKLTRTSGTTLTLAASHLNVGAFQYITSALTLNTATVGLGGVDVAVAASSLYYVYAVVSSGNPYLIASLSATAPSGYAQARRIGVFLTDSASAIYGLVNRDTAVTSTTKQTREISLSIGTVSGSASIANWSTIRAVGIFYADSAGGAGVWRMRFNIRGSFTAATLTSISVPVSGVVFSNANADWYQGVSAFFDVAAQISSYSTPNTGILAVSCASTSVNHITISGDVELQSEPTNYTVAAYMETPIYS